jgi:hypothetical protein
MINMKKGDSIYQYFQQILSYIYCDEKLLQGAGGNVSTELHPDMIKLKALLMS